MAMVRANRRGEGALSSDLEEMAGRLRGRSHARGRKRACVMIAGGSQRESGGIEEGVGRHDVFMLMTTTGAEGRWRGRGSNVSMISMRRPQ